MLTRRRLWGLAQSLCFWTVAGLDSNSASSIHGKRGPVARARSASRLGQAEGDEDDDEEQNPADVDDDDDEGAGG